MSQQDQEVGCGTVIVSLLLAFFGPAVMRAIGFVLVVGVCMVIWFVMAVLQAIFGR